MFAARLSYQKGKNLTSTCRMIKQISIKYNSLLKRLTEPLLQHYGIHYFCYQFGSNEGNWLPIVATASLFLHDEIAGLYNLVVLPEYRKQGIGTVLHYTRFNLAKDRGYLHATLQATPMASALNNSLGFETHSNLSIYKC